MEILNNLSAIIVLLSLIIFFIGIIKPSWIKLHSRKAVALITLGVFLLSMIIFSLTMSAEQKEAAKTKQEDSVTAKKIDQTETIATNHSVKKIEDTKPVVNTEISEDKHLKLTPEQFRKAFNKKLIALNLSSLRTLGEFSIQNGKVKDTFTVNITDAVSLIGKVSKSGNIESLMTIYDHSDIEKESLNFIIVTGLMIQAVSNDDELPKQLAPLLTNAIKNLETEKANNSKTVDDISYSTVSGKLMGTSFIIEPK